jgi:DNA-binding ferritin-like protein (Dps family)
MSAITLRNLPPRVAKAIREKARKERLSMNKTVIKLLEEATGATPEAKRVVHHDLDRFFGTWTKEEADAFDEALREQRQIEPEMWK